MVYIVILGLMTLTLFQGHSCVRNINCKLHVWEYCPHLLNVVQLLHALERLCTVYVWLLCVLKGHNMFLFSQARWKLYIWIYSDTINVINVRLCIVVLINYWALPVHFTFSYLDQISRSQQCQTVLFENYVFLSSKVETL